MSNFLNQLNKFVIAIEKTEKLVNRIDNLLTEKPKKKTTPKKTKK